MQYKKISQAPYVIKRLYHGSSQTQSLSPSSSCREPIRVTLRGTAQSFSVVNYAFTVRYCSCAAVDVL